MTCANVCDCNLTVQNTGVGCTPIMKVVKRPWLWNKYDSSGALNYIDLTDTLDDAYWQALINNADPLARLTPLPEIKNITDVREKPLTYAWKDSSEVFVRDGIRKFEGMFPPDSSSPQLVGILESARCANPAFLGVDEDGTVWGKISADGTKIYPIEIDPKSIAAIFVKQTDTEPQMAAWSFNFHPSEKDCAIRGIAQSEMEDDVDTLSYNGLLNVYAKVISCSTTKLVVKLYTQFGSVLNPLTVKNLLVANFSLYNVTTSSAILLTGTGSAFAESPEGTYSLTYKTADDPASTNVLRLTPTKDGFDFTAVVATSIVVA